MTSHRGVHATHNSIRFFSLSLDPSVAAILSKSRDYTRSSDLEPTPDWLMWATCCRNKCISILSSTSEQQLGNMLPNLLCSVYTVNIFSNKVLGQHVTEIVTDIVDSVHSALENGHGVLKELNLN